LLFRCPVQQDVQYDFSSLRPVRFQIERKTHLKGLKKRLQIIPYPQSYSLKYKQIEHEVILYNLYI